MDIYFDHRPGSHSCFNTSARTGQNQKIDKNSSCSCISIRNIGIYNYHISLGWVGVGWGWCVVLKTVKSQSMDSNTLHDQRKCSVYHTASFVT